MKSIGLNYFPFVKLYNKKRSTTLHFRYFARKYEGVSRFYGFS